MKAMLLSLSAFILLHGSLCSMAFAEDAISGVPISPITEVVPTEVPAQVDNDAWIQSVITAIGGMKGATTVAIIVVILQSLMAFLNHTTWGRSLKISGNAKFYIVGIAGLLIQPLTLVGQGMTFGAAFGTSVFITALMTFIFEAYKRIKSTATGQPA